MVATYKGKDIWSLVHNSGGAGLLAGKEGEMNAHNLSNLSGTLLRLAVAGQESGRAGGPTLTAR